ncbi:MAG: class I SAM-dependent methyltransferase [Bacteroidales bacterium]|jgi:predicted O-methyltransferase YrrM|nr:class I SAM-dependent methyltransferase [Bacteroidales bacterium]
MNKIQKFFRALYMIAGKPYLLNLVLDENEAWKKRVQKAYGTAGLNEVSLRDMMDSNEMLVKPFAFMEGGSIPTDLALLKLLASRFDPCNYFEIGTWRGESAANVAEVAEHCTTMNLPIARMKELGLPEDYIRQYAMFSKDLKNITHLQEDSLAFDFGSLGKKYDLIFIDGDHHYASVKKDTEKVFEHLVHNNSIVVWHDYAWQPGEVRYETLAAILAGVPAHLRGKIYAVRNTMCAVYFPDEVSANSPSAIALKEEAFEIRIK